MMVRRRALPSANKPPPTNNPNRLLAALPAADYTRILPSLTVVPLKLKELLHKPGDPIRDVYFPGAGFCSMLTVLEDGSMVEIATIGREGMAGVSAVLDGTPVTSAAMVQGASDTCSPETIHDLEVRNTYPRWAVIRRQGLLGDRRAWGGLLLYDDSAVPHIHPARERDSTVVAVTSALDRHTFRAMPVVSVAAERLEPHTPARGPHAEDPKRQHVAEVCNRVSRSGRNRLSRVSKRAAGDLEESVHRRRCVLSPPRKARFQNAW